MRADTMLPILLLCAGFSTAGRAAVPPSEAAGLGGALTPVGAERAGNRDGSIPAWTGGATVMSPGYREGDARPDPFTGEAKLFTIDGGNLARYAGSLPDGARALFAKFPDYHMNVYPAHRTAAAPGWVYDNIRRNAVRAHPVAAGIAYGVAGAAGGVPFPIPHDGTEIVWNHLLAFWGAAREAHVATYVVGADGTIAQTAGYREITDFPYYDRNASPEHVGAYYFKTRRLQDAPAARAGEAYIAWQPLDVATDRYVAWRYLPGEHRARKAPSLSYDTPDADASGYESLDEYYLFFGGPDRYDFRLLGKREMIVPYNNNALYLRPSRDALGPHHANQDALRYERHRVWVVEGTLAAGKHHVAPRRRLYVDEDTWMVVYAESWDEDGKLWKFGHATMYTMPDVPAVIIGAQFVYDLLQGGYAYDFAFGGGGNYNVTPLHDSATFDAQALAAEAMR